MQVINFRTEVRTMTSREIAEITGKQHKHVLEDVRKMLEELGITAADFATQYKDSYGRMQPCFNLPKRETLCLVLGYSFPMYERIVDRWEALETGKAKPAMVAPVNLIHSYTDAVAGMEVVARMLRLEGSAALGLVRKATEITAPHLLPAIPVYAIDAK